jgi:predicted methyltransferase MtxX (methanogen marker protein 4)
MVNANHGGWVSSSLVGHGVAGKHYSIMMDDFVQDVADIVSDDDGGLGEAALEP